MFQDTYSARKIVYTLTWIQTAQWIILSNDISNVHWRGTQCGVFATGRRPAFRRSDGSNKPIKLTSQPDVYRNVCMPILDCEMKSFASYFLMPFVCLRVKVRCIFKPFCLHSRPQSAVGSRRNIWMFSNCQFLRRIMESGWRLLYEKNVNFCKDRVQYTKHKVFGNFSYWLLRVKIKSNKGRLQSQLYTS